MPPQKTQYPLRILGWFRRSERFSFGFLFLVLIGIPFALKGGPLLFQRYFWFDEAIVELLTLDPSVWHLFSSLLHGDTHNGPVFFLLLRGWTAVFPFSTEVSFRSFSFLSLLLCSFAIYRILRMRYSPLVSALAALSPYSQEQWIYFAFDARYYGPWLAACAWHAYFLLSFDRETHSPRTQLAINLSGFLVVSLHDYGIFPWALLNAFRVTQMVSKVNIGLTWGGIGGFMVQLPFLYGQWHSFGDWGLGREHSWLGSVGWREGTGYLNTLLFRPYFRIFLILLLLHGKLSKLSEVFSAARHFRSLLVLALLPILLLALSFILLPIPQFAYAVPATLGLTPVLAYGLNRFRPFALLCFGICLFGLNCDHLAQRQKDAIALQNKYDRLIVLLRKTEPSLPIIDATGFFQLPLGRYAPELRERLFYAEFKSENGHCRRKTSHLAIYSQRKLAADFPFLRMVAKNDLDNYDSVVLLGRIGTAELSQSGCFGNFTVANGEDGSPWLLIRNPESHEIVSRI